MQNINYDKQTDKIIENLKNSGVRKKLLLHACCAPCASACIERVKAHFDLTVYFYNPNMDCGEEYLLRLKEAQRLCKELGVGFLSEEYVHHEFLDCAKGFEDALEGGTRC
ncbi:MAG: epoxyqueuosine reductase QueH, partial [Clostridia bacterium]|nr:epoxyqueuosine reductase QueH [Clostridia bacterium]